MMFFRWNGHLVWVFTWNDYPKKHLGDNKNSWNSAKTALFSAYEFFISEKIKWKSVLAKKKAVFQGEIRKPRSKSIFLWTIKTHEILRKQHFFLDMKVSFGYEKKQFFRGEIRKPWSKIIFLWTIKTHEILWKQYFFLHMNYFIA